MLTPINNFSEKLANREHSVYYSLRTVCVQQHQRKGVFSSFNSNGDCYEEWVGILHNN